MSWWVTFRLFKILSDWALFNSWSSGHGFSSSMHLRMWCFMEDFWHCQFFIWFSCEGKERYLLGWLGAFITFFFIKIQNKTWNSHSQELLKFILWSSEYFPLSLYCNKNSKTSLNAFSFCTFVPLHTYVTSLPYYAGAGICIRLLMLYFSPHWV